MLNLAWALAIVFTDVPAGALADRVGRKPLIVAATLCMIGIRSRNGKNRTL